MEGASRVCLAKSLLLRIGEDKNARNILWFEDHHLTFDSGYEVINIYT